MTASAFLQLPQELRDVIYDHLIPEGDINTGNNPSSLERQSKRLTTRNDRWQWNIQYPTHAPNPTYLNLMKTNRQLHHEITSLLHRTASPPPARLELFIDYPLITPTWTHIPHPPPLTHTLAISIKVNQLYHPAFITRPPHNALLTALFETLKTYIHRGPHFIRLHPLAQRLRLETVRVTLAPPQPLEEMTYIYGFPAQQLEVLYRDFRAYVARFARSGVVGDDVGAFEVGLQGREGWERIPVTGQIWDEEDVLFFRDGGYRWSE